MTLFECGEILQHYDISGCKGSIPCPRRTNLLVTIDGDFTEYGDMAFRFTQYAAEGFGPEAFMHDHMNIPADEILEEDQLLIWNVEGLPKLHAEIWLFDVREDFIYKDQFVYHYVYDNKSQWALLPSPEMGPPYKVAEFFGGGFGGWKAAGSVLHQCVDLQSQFVAVEHDLATAVAYTITHKTGFFSGTEFLTETSFDNGKHWMIHADVFDPKLRAPLTAWSPQIVTISAPCPPWSGAASAKGLDSIDGQKLMKAILETRWLRPHVILIEQVLGFNHHPHKDFIIRTLHFVGYRLVYQKTMDLMDVTLTSRNRWLGIAIRVHSSVRAAPVQNWPRYKHTMHPNPVIVLPEQLYSQTAISDCIKAIASDPSCSKHAKDKTPTEVLQSRLYKAGEILPTFMAQYGNQHGLDTSFLKKHGYFGHFLLDEHAPHGFRFWHAAEIALIHGVYEGCFLPTNQLEANMLLGNMIAIPHALTLLVQGINRIQPNPIDLKTVCEYFHDHQVHLARCQIISLANGFYLTHDRTLMLTSFKQHVEALHQWASTQDKCHVWLPDQGLVRPDQVRTQPFSSDHVSIVTPEDSDSETEDPAQHPIMKGTMTCTTHATTFWFSANLPAVAIEEVWAQHFALQFQGKATSITAELRPKPCFTEPQDAPSKICAVCLIDYDLSILSVDPDKPLMIQENIKTLAPVLYDQYGQMDLITKPDFRLVLLDKPLQHGALPQHLVFYAAANHELTTTFHQCNDQDTFVIQLQGRRQAISIMKEFWTSCLTSASLDQLGRHVKIETNQVRFEPNSDTGVCPLPAFREALSVQAAKMLLDAAQDHSEAGLEVLIKWGRPVWRGKLPADTTIQTIQMLLQFTFSPITGGIPMRLVSKGKVTPFDASLKQLESSPHRNAIILFATVSMKGGGSKQQQKGIMQNAIATALLDQGYPLSWTTKAVDEIVQKTNLQRLQTITAKTKIADRISEITQLCSEHRIEMPDPTQQSTREAIAGAPWNRKKRRPDVVIHPSDFKIAETFFKFSDGSNATQIDHIRPQANGVAILNATDAIPVLQQGQKLSADELGLVALGSLPPMDLKGEEVTIPCTNAQGHQVLLHGKLFQLGNKDIQVNKGNPNTVQDEPCQLIAITMYKDQWKEPQWHDILSNTAGFIRKTMATEGIEGIQAIWGRSLRQGKAAASPLQATSIQVHATVEPKSVTKMLMKSGFNGLFLTPKLTDGRLASDYRVLWLKGEAPKALGLSTQTSNCQGLIRGKNGELGLRYHSKDFAAAWAIVHPTIPAPDDMSGTLTFKIEGLPFGTTIQCITTWAASLPWQCKPFRAVGPTSWVVKASQPPPDGIPMYNSTPVLIRKLEPRNNQATRILIGPRPRSSVDSNASGDPWHKGADPWHNWRPTSTTNQLAPAAPRAIEGPIETRFAAQDAAIASLREDLAKMHTQHDDHTKAVKEQFRIAEKREQAEFTQIKTAMSTMQKEMDHHLANTMQQHTKAMDSQFRELKALFQQAGKRRAPADEEDANMG